MMFGIITIIFTIFFLTLDYAYIYCEKKRKVLFYSECLICLFIFFIYAKSIFASTPLYSDGGIKIDALVFLLLSREAILNRIGRGETNYTLTSGIRRNAINSKKKIKDSDSIMAEKQSNTINQASRLN